MIHTAIRPVTLRGSEQAENLILAGQQNVVLDSKSALNPQLRSLISYTVDAHLNVIQLKFSHSPSGENLP